MLLLDSRFSAFLFVRDSRRRRCGNVEIRRFGFLPDFQARRKEGKTRFCLWSFPRFPRRVISTATGLAVFNREPRCLQAASVSRLLGRLAGCGLDTVGGPRPLFRRVAAGKRVDRGLHAETEDSFQLSLDGGRELKRVERLALASEFR